MNTAKQPTPQASNEPAKDAIIKVIREYNQSTGFTDRKLTDTPTDALAVVNRNYVTLNGSSANRPPSPITGQYYFDTSLGFPVWFNGTTFVNASGNPS